jgi:hypothetical protein
MTALTIDIEAADAALAQAEASWGEALSEARHPQRYARFGALCAAQFIAHLQRQQQVLAEGERMTQEEADALAAVEAAKGAYGAFSTHLGVAAVENGYTGSADARTQLLAAIDAATDALAQVQG